MEDRTAVDAPYVEIETNGPYVVHGQVPITRRRIVCSADGEPLAWETTEPLAEGDDEVWLCRCGRSSNKPFCDGTHETWDFPGEETAPTTGYEQRMQVLGGVGIVVRDDRSVCIHAGFCTNRATSVWKMVGGEDAGDEAVRAQVIAMIERCPSGALTYRLEPDGEDVEVDVGRTIGVVDDGPLLVNGGIEIRRSDGQPMERRNRVALCRCGQSSQKPLCDGSHVEVGFHDP
jgi:CDGSH-type Zn-finger protein/ferredoxin